MDFWQIPIQLNSVQKNKKKLTFEKIAPLLLTISSVGFFDATIICNIFSLGVNSVELHIEIRNCIIAILGNDTLCFFHIFVFSYRVPPVYQITWGDKKKREISKILEKKKRIYVKNWRNFLERRINPLSDWCWFGSICIFSIFIMVTTQKLRNLTLTTFFVICNIPWNQFLNKNYRVNWFHEFFSSENWKCM